MDHYLPEILYNNFRVCLDISKAVLEYLPNIMETISYDQLCDITSSYHKNKYYSKIIIYSTSNIKPIVYLCSQLYITKIKKSKKNRGDIMHVTSYDNKKICYIPIPQNDKKNVRFILDHYTSDKKLINSRNNLDICSECGCSFDECYKIIKEHNDRIKRKNKYIYKKNIRSGYCRKINRCLYYAGK